MYEENNLKTVSKVIPHSKNKHAKCQFRWKMAKESFCPRLRKRSSKIRIKHLVKLIAVLLTKKAIRIWCWL